MKHRRREIRTLLNAFVATTGYHRTYARWLLNHAEEVQRTHGRSQIHKYGPDVQHALFLTWHAANCICANRLMPFLPILIEATSAARALPDLERNAASNCFP